MSKAFSFRPQNYCISKKFVLRSLKYIAEAVSTVWHRGSGFSGHNETVELLL
jgi:hypothetical protein